ncbi:MAG: FlgK family flagellar hook-associated protein [Alphaproteobacteria bacterium]
MFSLVTTGLKLGTKLSDEHNVNTASSQDPDFCRHEMQGKTVTASGRVTGVTGTIPKRAIDTQLHKAYKNQNSSFEGTQVPALYFEKLQPTLGRFAGEDNLSNYVTQVLTSLDALARRPDDIGLIQGVVISSQTLAASVREISNKIQSLRSEADQEIYKKVNELKAHLKEYADLNKQIKLLYDKNPLDLQSKRDAVAFEISKYLPIVECNEHSGGFSLYCDGHLLVHDNFIAEIYFENTAFISASSTNLSGIKIEVCDVTNDLKKLGLGTLGNLLKMRDETLPNLQAELDEFAYVLREWMNKYHNNGASYNLQTLKIGTQILPDGGATVLTNPQGIMRIATINQTTKALVDVLDLDLSTCVTLQDVFDAINAVASMNASMTPENKVKLESIDPNCSIAVVDLDPPSSVESTDGNTLSLSHFVGLQDFFVTPDFLNGVRSAGIANVFDVNPYYSENPEFTECGTLSRLAEPDYGDGIAVEKSDAETIQAMQDLSEKKVTFEIAGFLPKFDGDTLLNYAQNIIEDFAIQTDKAVSIFECERSLFEDLEEDVKNFSQPNIQDEMQELLFCQMYLQSLMGVFNILRSNSDLISRLLMNA